MITYRYAKNMKEQVSTGVETIPEQKVGKSKIYVDLCQDKKRREQLCP